MEQERKSTPQRMDQHPNDWERSIHKLRWIGWEDEAKQLETAVSTARPQQVFLWRPDPIGIE
jgi:hypothetical protein